MVKLNLFHFLLITFFYTQFQTNHAKNNGSGFSLKMVHWNSPELPSHKPNQTREEIMNELVRMSNARLKTLEHLIALNFTRIPKNQVAIRPELEPVPSRGIFLVEVGIGTFHTQPSFVPTYLALQITSDYTWTQCEGCSPCFHQRGPLFPWQSSQTFRELPCTVCPTAICEGGHCVLDIPWGVGGHIRGYKATETFIFPSDGANVQIPNMEFSCVFSSQGYRDTATEADIESGVFSLSRQGYANFMRLIGDTRINNGRFSYCLPPLDQPIHHRLLIRFGRDIPPLRYQQTIPILPGPHPGSPLYFLDLKDIGVGARKLRIDPRVFDINRNSDGGCFLETSIAMSYLPRVAYTRLERALASSIETRNAVMRIASPFTDLQFCYKRLTTSQPIIPVVKFYFANDAFISVEPMGRYIHENEQLLCLLILPNNAGDSTIIGAMQQANHRFVFDLRHSLLKFDNVLCAASQ